MKGFVLWLILFYFSWPLALIALILYPIIWLLLLPFRIFGFVFDAVFAFIRSIIMLPGRILSRPR